MTTASLDAMTLTSRGFELDASPEAFGQLRDSSDVADRPEILRQRIEENGYLYVPGFFDREEVMEVRRSLTDRIAAQGFLDPAYPSIEAVIAPDRRTAFLPKLADGNDTLRNFIFGAQLREFYEAFFAEKILHFDFIWIRAVSRGHGTMPHCDIVYMGRGTHDLLTAWIPYGDIPLELGGLIVLEDSHKKSERIRKYLAADVDSYCANDPAHADNPDQIEGRNFRAGWLSTNPASLREKLGGRWLTADWKAGDLLTFKMNIVHASLDNQTDCIRLSTDTRYQPASQPADDRWIGPNPTAHSRASKRGRIC